MPGPAHVFAALLTRLALTGAAALVAVPLSASEDTLGETRLGNGLFPVTPLPGAVVDERGFQLYKPVGHSASGIQYPLVVEYPVVQPMPESDGQNAQAESAGWVLDGMLELGWLVDAGTTETASFREFADFSSEAMVGRFAFEGSHPERGDRISLFGAAPGRDDQYFGLEYRRPGSFRAGGWYNEIPHVFATNARVLWDGIGTGELTLPEGLVPGRNDAAAVRAALAGRGVSVLKLERRRGGVFARLAAFEALDLYFDAATERREGARPFGGTFAYPGLGQFAETVEPIDYLTHEIDTGLRFTGRRFQANLAYAGSFFANDTDSLVWEDPGLSLFEPPFVVERGRAALAPDNRFHQVSADLAVRLPVMRGRWTASLAWNRKSQDDELLPPTISSGRGTVAGTAIDFDLWNTLQALSQKTADARIGTVLAQSEITLNPIRRLRTTIEVRFLDEDNDTGFTTFNPLAGEFGTIRADGGIVFDGGIFQPGRAGDLIRIRNVAHATDELAVTLGADYRLAARTRLAATLSYDRTEREHRQRGETVDRRVRIQITDRSGLWASLRVAGEFGRRAGDGYDDNPLAPFLSSTLNGFTALFGDRLQPLELSDLREFDLASRDQWVADWQLRFNPGRHHDVAVGGRLVDDDFDAEFGLQTRRRFSANGEWSYNFADNGSTFVHYSFQDLELDSSGINDLGPIAPDASAGGPVFPLENLWRRDLAETNHAAGTGVTYQWRRFLLEADYTFGLARTRRGFGFAGPGATAAGIDPETAASGLHLQRFERHLLNASVRFPITRRLGARLFYRLEAENIADPNFAGLADPVTESQLFLLARPEDFTAHVIGIFVEIDVSP